MTHNTAAINRKPEKIGFYPRDPISCVTHLIGAFAGVIATFLFVLKSTSATVVDPIKVFSSLAFGISIVLLYSASALYHYVSEQSPQLSALRRLDHSMIYVLIAGSYTPVLLNMDDIKKGSILTAVIWSIAFVGVGVKVFVPEVPRLFSTICYIAMGWFILIDLNALISLTAGGIILLAAGGIFYTVGGIIYAVKKPNISKTFGFHELFHIFVMLGSLFHFFSTYFYIL